MSTGADRTEPELARYGYVVREEWGGPATEPGSHRYVSWHAKEDPAVRATLRILWKWRLLARLGVRAPLPTGVTVMPMQKPEFVRHQQRVCASGRALCSSPTCYPLIAVTRLFRHRRPVPDLMAALLAPAALRPALLARAAAEAAAARPSPVLQIAAPRRPGSSDRHGRGRQTPGQPARGSSVVHSRRRRGRRPREC